MLINLITFCNTGNNEESASNSCVLKEESLQVTFSYVLKLNKNIICRTLNHSIFSMCVCSKCV